MKRVRDAMLRTPVCCTPDDGVIHCARLMERDDLRIIPVVESMDTRKLVGMVTDRGLCLLVIAGGLVPHEVVVEECMEDELFSINEDDDLGDALALMRREDLPSLPVVDENGACVGVLVVSAPYEWTPREASREE